MKWSRIDDEISREMSGLSVDLQSPDKIDPEGTLAFMQELMDVEWMERIKSTYQQVRAALRSENASIRLEARIGRNAPCPCGSGRKYKRCYSNQ